MSNPQRDDPRLPRRTTTYGRGGTPATTSRASGTSSGTAGAGGAGTGQTGATRTRTRTNRPAHPSGRPPRPPRTGWRRFVPRWPWVVGGLVALFLLVAGAFVLLWVTTPIPAPNAEASAQQTQIFYNDGKTVFATLGTNRVNVPLSQVPEPVRQAVLAAEDRTFYEHSAINPLGIVRALWVNVTSGSVSQGGSTITQQYAKNTYLTQDRTLSRKLKEAVLAIKLERQQSKDQILENYLNSIYFGRGAYGIQAAAKACFGKDVAQLDVSQGALLAAVIKSPSTLDPAKSPDAAKARWQYVVDGMVTMNVLSRAAVDALAFPATVPYAPTNTLSGPQGFVVQAVQAELNAKGFTADRVDAGGFRITTTLDPKAQQAAVTAEQRYLGTYTQPVSALVAVQPGDGAIRAMYGGRDYGNAKYPANQLNLATQAARQAGSAFKPFALTAALQNGESLYDTFPAPSSTDLTCDGKPFTVKNDSNLSFGTINLIQATQSSVNTVYVPLSMKVGLDKVAQAAHTAGIPQSVALSDPGGSISCTIALGVYSVHPVDMAAAYATFAAQGVRAQPYLIAKVTDPTGGPLYQSTVATTRAFDAATTSQVTYALQQVVQRGTGTKAQLAGGRPAAGKTGTTTKNTDAWFCGFTPQLAAAVWVGDTDNKPLQGIPGLGDIYGGSLSAPIWKAFMDATLAGQPVEQFPPVSGGQTASVAPAPPTAAPSTAAPSTPAPRPSSTAPATPSATASTASARPSSSSAASPTAAASTGAATPSAPASVGPRASGPTPSRGPVPAGTGGGGGAAPSG